MTQVFFSEIFPDYYGFILSRAIYTGAKLQIAEALENGPLSGRELSDKLCLPHQKQLERLINYLASVGIFSYENERYHKTALSEELLLKNRGISIIENQDRYWYDFETITEPEENLTYVESLSRLYMQSRAIQMACKMQLFEKQDKDPSPITAHLEKAGLIKDGKNTAKGALFLDPKLQAFILHDDEARMRALGGLEDAVRDNIVPFVRDNQMSYFSYIKTRPATEKLFSDAMSFVSSHEVSALVEQAGMHIRTSCRVADIGGGQGIFLKEVLKKYPGVQGILFDMEETVKNHVLENISCNIVGGDFFKEVPEADIYLFKRVLHDWSNADAVEILKTCKRAAKPGAKVILYEMILPQKEALMCDVYFMANLDGCQRHAKDFEEIAEKSGWKVESISKTSCWLGEIVLAAHC